MNDDALAAIVAAATVLLRRGRRVASAGSGSRWGLAARARMTDAAVLRRVAEARSRWSQQGRPHE